MEDLEKAEKDLADYFCEDHASFHIDECFKSLAGFFAKFKKVSHSFKLETEWQTSCCTYARRPCHSQAITDNANRMEQEAMAAQRRAQREEAKKVAPSNLSNGQLSKIHFHVFCSINFQPAVAASMVYMCLNFSSLASFQFDNRARALSSDDFDQVIPFSPLVQYCNAVLC